MAPLSSANGFLAVPLALFVVLRARRSRAALLTAACSLIALGIFLCRYVAYDPSGMYPKTVSGYRFLVKRRERVAFGLRQYQADPHDAGPGDVFEVELQAARLGLFTRPTNETTAPGWSS